MTELLSSDERPYRTEIWSESDSLLDDRVSLSIIAGGGDDADDEDWQEASSTSSDGRARRT